MQPILPLLVVLALVCGFPQSASAQPSLGGTWNGAVLEARSQCASAVNNGNHGTYAQFDIGIGPQAIEIAQLGITGLRCDYTGTYSQNGTGQNAAGNFTCSDGRRGTWLATHILVTEVAMSLTFAERLNGAETCQVNAVINGARLAATNAPQPSIDYTGAWYKADESGWGVSVVRGASNVLGVILYHYDPDRSPAWFIVQEGAWQNTTTFSGALYRVSGPAYTEAFDAGAVARVRVGSATLTFATGSTATLQYTVEGVERTKAITRLTF